MKHLALIALLLGISASAAEDRLQQAIRLQQHKPSPEHDLGLLEMRRAAAEKLDYPRLADQVRPTKENASLLQVIAWRMLPTGQGDRSAFLRIVDTLEKSDPQNAWSAVFRLYAESLGNDRTALIAQARKIAEVPTAFPTVAAEKAHLDLLRELGLDDNQAAMEVITHRTFAPLHALLDLDRVLTREIDFLNGTSKSADAKILSTCRDKLRQAWLDSSKHLVERLFALHVLGRKQECDALLFAARELPYLTDSTELSKVLAKMDQKESWQAVIAPLLDSEVALITAPPKIPATMPAATAEVSIEAKRKTVSEGIATYEGAVRVKCRSLSITCDKLAVVGENPDSPRLLSGAGNITITGAAGFQSIQAQHFTFSFDTGAFSLSGDVRLKRGDTTIKLKAATLSRTGELRDQVSLLDELDKAADIKSKLALLPKLSAVYSDDELPAEARYLLAMSLLRPHLQWHEPFDEPRRQHLMQIQQMDEMPVDSRWREAHGGESWMREDALRQLQASRRDALRNDKVETLLARELPRDFFWTLSDTKHPDIARARKLLDSITAGNLAPLARHWSEEIARNNAVVTMELAGAFVSAKPARVVVDVRSSNRIALSIYRVRDAQTLLAAAGQIGDDFLFRDYGFDNQQSIQEKVKQLAKRRDLVKRVHHAPPTLDEADLLRRWELNVAELKPLEEWRTERARWDDWDDDEDEESAYFDDHCEHFRDRIDKSYAREGRTTWRANRVVDIPADLLKESGAYILVAQAGDCRAVAPLLVDPLSLLLRRCRDGVFVSLSTPDATKPIAGGTILADNIQATTDANGVAFARVFAAGDRPILAAADGRYAIGGFGEVFEGIYRRADDYGRFVRARLLRDRMQTAHEPLAQVYEDRHVVAAYTDRPTYRPGQDVHFKLIARKGVISLFSSGATQPTAGFRDEDFNRSPNLNLLPDGTRFTWAVLSPRGREIASGNSTLNDFGTAADTLRLGEHAEVGLYSMKITLGGMDRVVPQIFAVKYYRRPNFDLAVTGLPEKLEKPEPIQLKLSGSYYFGKPVSDGQVTLLLTHEKDPHPLAQSTATLDTNGLANAILTPPPALPAGAYRILATLTDASGLAFTRSFALPIGSPDSAKSPALPRFHPFGQPLVISTPSPEVVISQERNQTTRSSTIRATAGQATVTFPSPGWYQVGAGSRQADLFVFAPAEDPFATAPSSSHDPGFVNLTSYSEEGDGEPGSYEPAWQQVHALFAAQQAKVGDSLKLLIHAPVRQPRLLFTFEGRTIADYAILTPAGDGPYYLVDLPLRARHLPNFYLQARVIGGGAAIDLPQRLRQLKEQLARDEESHDPAWCRVDVTDSSAAAPGQNLRIELTADKTDYRPGDTVKLSARVTDAAGQARQAELSLAAVDESVFSFGDFDPNRVLAPFVNPHPQRRFLPKSSRSSFGATSVLHRAHAERLQQMAQQMAKAIDAADTKHDVTRQLEAPAPLPPLGRMPVAQIPLAALRSDFRETAAWLPQLRTDERGVLAASFKLPDSLTAYRLTAIGVTRQTQLGLATARLRANLPLSVQLILPRFAVEKDRFAAVALLHNSTDAPLDAAVTLDFNNISAQPAPPWKVANNSATATLTIPAKSSSTLPLDLLCDKPALASFTLRAASKAHADAEQRTLKIIPLGRPAEVSFNGAFDTAHALSLPDGFVPSDLHISLSRGQVAHSLDGLAYLIEYPYGCVEQTMSRFLPAVVVKAAARDLPLDLPPNVVARLPDVISKGLQRLYSFQRPDGGWGWWAQDQASDRMSIYVFGGLARSQLAGVAVEQTVLERGAAYLNARLPQLDPPTRAAAYHALALAGRADKPQLQTFSTQLASESAHTRCTAALACRAAGLTKEGQSLWKTLADWQPTSAAELADKLSAQLAFGDAIPAANATAALLCSLRQGHRWDSTQTTATAITALAQVLQYTTASAPAKTMRIKVADQVALDARDDQLTKSIFRVRLTGPQIAHNQLPIRFETDPAPATLYAVTATGYQRLDNAQPTGTAIRLTRAYTTLDGQPLVTARPSQVIAVNLTLHLDRPQEYLIIEDFRPSIFEYAGEDLTGPAASRISNAEFRDDRAALFFTALPAGQHTLTYYLRAQTKGQSHALPAAAYPMYNEKQKGESATAQLTVNP